VPRVSDLGQHCQQARRVFGGVAGEISKMVKGRVNQ
jgi:hypothetical protein